jgi:hypothetical protein
MSQGRCKTIAFYAAAWGPNVLGAPKTLVEYQVLCQNILYVNSHLSISVLSAKITRSQGFHIYFSDKPWKYWTAPPGSVTEIKLQIKFRLGLQRRFQFKGSGKLSFNFRENGMDMTKIYRFSNFLLNASKNPENSDRLLETELCLMHGVVYL